jgi:outer membrane receptor protein involved in Fe transport
MVSLRSTRNPGRFVLAAVMALLLCGIAVAQQETGQISGTIKDQSGGVIAGATVAVRNLATSLERVVTTNQSGNFVVTNLPPGAYSATATMKGFNTAKRQIQVTVGSMVGADITLEVGSATTVIEVAGTSEQVNIENQVLMDVVTTKQVETLPTLTRNPYDLVAIGGNISPDGDGANRGTGYSINGQRSASTNILLDGADNNDNFDASLGQSVPLDSVQEFSVVTSSFTAEYGRASGGVVNVATKSGSNSLHGSAYEFNRVSALSSNGFDNNAYDIPRGVFTRNQFGYSVGGPIVKDKFFFFNNTEWTRIRSGSTSTALIATPQLIGAANKATQDFFTAYGKLKSGLILGKAYTKTEIPGICDASGTLCEGLSDTLPLFQTVSYPVPADSGGGDPSNQYQTVIRLDYNMSPNTTIYGRFALESVDAFSGTNAESPYQGFDSGYTVFNQNYLLSLTHTFGPKLVSQSKIVFNRLNQEQPLGDQPANATLYLTAGTASIKGINTAFPGYLPYTPSNGIPFGGPQNLGQLYEDVSWIKGNHTFRFGGQYIYLRDNRTFGAYAYATQQLGTSVATGFENFLRGQQTTWTAAVYPQGKYPGEVLTLPVGPPDFTRSNRYSDFAFYGQDTWRIAPRWTVNLGLRWEYFGVQHNKYPEKDSNFFLGGGSTMEEQVKTGKVEIAPKSSYNGLWGKDLNNWAPRLGVAWDVFGNGKTSLRGGYGISYERNFGNVTFNVIQNPPNNATVSVIPSDFGGNLPIYVDRAGPLGGTSGTKTLPRSSLRAVNEKIKNAYAHAWSAAIEQELSRGTVFSMEYSGSAGVGLYSLNRENLPGSLNAYTKVAGFSYLNSQYAVINYRTTGGYSRYHGMIASLRTQNLFNQGLQLQANYTWGHAIDNLSSTFTDSNKHYTLGFLDPRNPMMDKGDADFDVRHRVAISAIWEPPYARNLNPVAKALLDGWSFSPMVWFRTGTPFEIIDSTNGYYASARMSIVNPQALSLSSAEEPSAISDTPNSFKLIDFNSQASGAGTAVNPYTGTSDFGPYPDNMSRRNLFRRPGAYMVDLGINKNFGFKNEAYKIQFRAEFYNLLNHANLDMTDNYVDLWSQDYVPGWRDGRRNIQFALKFIF